MVHYYKFERMLGAMKRFHAKIQQIRDGVEAFYPGALRSQVDDEPSVAPLMPKAEGNDPNTLQDYVLAFFIFSHSMKDWIINDDEIGGSKEERKKRVKSFIDANKCLQIAADIANGAKHLERDMGGPISGSQPEWLFTHSKVGNAFPGGYLRVIVKSSGTIRWGTKEIDALSLATECLLKWEEYTGDIYKAQKDRKEDRD